jgi:hypothetical protein
VPALRAVLPNQAVAEVRRLKMGGKYTICLPRPLPRALGIRLVQHALIPRLITSLLPEPALSLRWVERVRQVVKAPHNWRVFPGITAVRARARAAQVALGRGEAGSSPGAVVGRAKDT